MEKKGKNQGKWDRFPEELQIQILYLLPVQTLLVLRAVGKWFRSTVDRRDFILSHRYNFPQNISENTPFIIKNIPSKIPVATYFRRINRLILPSSVHGVSVVVDDTFGNVSFNASLANFTTKTARPLPRCDWLMVSEFKQFFVGYDKTRRDFRVLAKTARKVSVFSLGKRAWDREISSARSGFRGTNKELKYVICSRSLCFENALVWTESDRDEPDSLGLVWFGLGDEKFRYSEKVPSVGCRSSGLMLLDGGAGLGVWTVNDDMGHIWALQTDTMTWAQRYEVPRELVPFGDNIMVANVVERGGKLESWCWNEEEKSLETVSYDVRKCAISRSEKKSYGKTCSCAPYDGVGDPTEQVCFHGEFICLGGAYIESLVKF